MVKEVKKQKVVHIEERMIKIKNFQLEALFTSQALQTLIESKDLTPKITFRLMLLAKELQEMAGILGKVKQGVINKYVDRDEKGNPVQLNNQFIFTEHREQFNKEVTELMEQESTIPQKKLLLNIEDLPMGALSAKDMLILDPVINFREE